MKTFDIDSLEPDGQPLEIDVGETCSTLSSSLIHADSYGLVDDDFGAGMITRFEVLSEVCEKLGLSHIPFILCGHRQDADVLTLGDLLTLLGRACSQGHEESAQIDLLEDLDLMENGIDLDAALAAAMGETGDGVPLDIDALIDALDSCGSDQLVFADIEDGGALILDAETVFQVSEILFDHGRPGMSENVALEIAKRYIDPEEAVLDDIPGAVKVHCLSLKDIARAEDYTFLGYLEKHVFAIEDSDVKYNVIHILVGHASPHHLREAFDEAGLADVYADLRHHAMREYVRNWCTDEGYACL